MSFTSESTQQKFPFHYGEVFDCLVATIPKTGFKLKSQDKVIGRISASTGISLSSYGENVAIVVERIDVSNSLVRLESGLKVGMNFTGTSRHAKNFETIIGAVSSRLQSGADWRNSAFTPIEAGSASLIRVVVAVVVMLGIGVILVEMFL